MAILQFPELGRDYKKLKYSCKHTQAPKFISNDSSYLQVLVGFEGPNGSVSEFNVVESLIRGVFVDFATGEPIPMLLSQRCHFYYWRLLATFCLLRHGGDGRVGGASTQTHARTRRHARKRSKKKKITFAFSVTVVGVIYSLAVSSFCIVLNLF